VSAHGRQEKGCEIHDSANAFGDRFNDRTHGEATKRVTHQNDRPFIILARHLFNQGRHGAGAILLAHISIG
jgi:hypothetical protein